MTTLTYFLLGNNEFVFRQNLCSPVLHAATPSASLSYTACRLLLFHPVLRYGNIAAALSCYISFLMLF